MTKEKRSSIYRFLRILAKIMLGLLIFFVLLLLFIRSPWGQGIIVNKATSYVTDKTNTRVEIDRLYITFSGNVYLEGLFVDDKKGDTLLYSKSLEADIPIWPIIRGNDIVINSLEWDGLKANVTRKDSIEGFNFQFLIDAFAAEEEEKKITQETPADTTSTMSFSLEKLNFSQFDLVYNDEVTGIESSLKLGELNLTIEDMDLEKSFFHIRNAEINNTDFQYLQILAFPEKEDTEDTAQPLIIVDNFSVRNLTGNYESVTDGIALVAAIGKLDIRLPGYDIANNRLNLEHLALQNSTLSLEITTEQQEETVETIAGSKPFEWPEWDIIADKIDITNNDLRYAVNGAQVKKGTFDPNILDIHNLNFKANDVYLRNQSAGIFLETLAFEEGSGLDLSEFSGDITLNENHASVSQLNLQLNNNYLEGDFDVRYDSMDDLLNKPENSQVVINIPSFDVSLGELFRFQPELRNNEYLRELSRRKINGELRVNGLLSSLEIPNATIRWGASTRINARGTINNVMDPENIHFDFPQFSVSSVRADLVRFLNEEELGISVPNKVNLSGNFIGNPEDIMAQADLKTSDGNISINGNYLNKEELAFNADVEVVNLKLDKILNNEQLGELNLTIQTKGGGSSLNDLDAVFEATITSFQLPNYTIEDLTLSGDIENGQGFINSEYKDENLDIELETLVQLDTVSSRVVVDLNLIGADFQALGVTSRYVRGGLKLRADFTGNAEEFEVETTITDAIAIYEQNPYLLGDVDLYAFVKKDTTSLVVYNRLVQLQLHSNSNPADFSRALERHLNSYFTEEPLAHARDTVIPPVEVNLRANINQAPILRDIFFPGLTEMDTINVRIDFDEGKRNLMADIQLPHLIFRGNEVDSLSFRLDSNENNFDFILGFNEVNAGPLSIKKTSFIGEVENRSLFLELISKHEEDIMLQIKTEISRTNDILRLHIDPSNLILNRMEWIVPASNEMLISNEKIDFTDFRLSYQNQMLALRSDLPEAGKDHVGLQFDNFSLEGLLGFLNPEEYFATGTVNGNIIFEEPLGSTGLVANLIIDNLEIIEIPMGTLTLEANSVGGKSYDFDLALKGGDMDLDLTGDFQADETAALINLDLDINEIKMRALHNFTGGEITDGDGSMSGKIKIGGTTTEPQYEGNFSFNNAAFRIAQLNALFRIPDDNLRVNNEGINFNNFRIEDSDNNRFIVNGEITTENILNPDFNLTMTATKFQVLNSTSEHNDLFYGKAILDMEAEISGNLNLPKVNLRITVGEDTDVTYIIPEEELDIIERKGVLIFVNREDPEDILTRQEEEALLISGFEISAIINIERDAVFNVIINEKTGDNFKITGEGNLNFNIYSNGRTTLSGRYLVNDGHFEMNLYNLVQRRFDIAPGGSVVWAGDPLDADLDIRAIYRVETAASPLMAAQLTGASSPVSGRYRQELPFLVYLNITGEMMEPKLNFNLDMPEDQRGAIGGEVYGRVQQLNQQEEEVNKQVFSLLVLNRFFPESGSDGAAGGAEAIARDNLNQALSSQINTLSDKLLGKSGFELDFGLDSFTDYQGATPEDRTQLDITAQKKLFDDRLIVSVGSEVDIQGSSQMPGEPSPVIGNVGIEYLLTEDGRFRLKGFRRNQYENVIDGQLIVSGIALIFTREFNKFRELWEAKMEEENPDMIPGGEKSEEEKEIEVKEEEEEEVKDNTEENSENDEEPNED